MAGLIGKAVSRKEGISKVTGSAKYIADLEMPGALYGTTVRSSVSRGVLRDIIFKPGIDWSGFTIVTAADIPGANVVTLIEKDQPFLADKHINHKEEPVVLLAHPDKYILEQARNEVELVIDPLPEIHTIEQALAGKQIVWGNDNVLKEFLSEKGAIDTAWAKAAYQIEGSYQTGAQEQLYIENNGMIAQYDDLTGVTVHGSMQCPYYIHRALVPLFDLPENKIRIVQTETGGGFGGKEEFPSMLAGHAALLAYKARKPVKMFYSRDEDMAVTTKRHPSRTQIKTGFDKEGKLVAIDVDFVIDGGAYATLSSVVLSRGTLHAIGPYACEHSRVRARAVATNTPPHGAFRGFGAPQSIFAWERHLDVAAKQIGLTPIEIRRRNFLKKGQTTATGQLIRENINLDGLLDRAMKESNFEAKQKQFAEQNKTSAVKKGIGLSCFMHGAGFTGSGEKYLASIVEMQARDNGAIEIMASSTEIGQGTNTIFSQIAAEALGVPYEWIDVVTPDTARVPNSGPTVASRTCMIVGKLVQDAALEIKAKLAGKALWKDNPTKEDFKAACTKYIGQAGRLHSRVQYEQPANVQWDEATYRGDAYATYAWAVYVAEVSVDTRTYEIQVDDFVAVQEVGKVIHPVLAEGQIEGGVAQGIGFAIYEKVRWDKGRMINNQMTNYIMPTTKDIPSIRVFFEEANRLYGPQGAKGIGELPMDGPAPAVMSAVENAVGVSVHAVPMLPEDLMEAMDG